MEANALPTIPLDLREHRITLIITCAVIFTSGGLLPVVLYLVLIKVAGLKAWIVLAIIASIIGAGSVMAMVQRVWRLIRRDSTCRPRGTTTYQLDYFQWNFFVGFIFIAGFLIVGISAGHAIGDISVRLASLPLPFLMLQISFQLLYASLMIQMRGTYPFRVSSMNKGDLIRPGTYTIVEDVTAVDGGQGREFRELLKARYDYSQSIQDLFRRLDWAWGASGMAVASGLVALIWALPDVDVGFTLSWLVPWVWAASLALLSRRMCKAALVDEQKNVR